MSQFIDVHTGMKNLTAQDLKREHDADAAHEREHGVHFIKAWADPDSGKVFCLSEGPNKEAVLAVHREAGHPTEEIYEVRLSTE
jgi:hypothetical protein